MQTRNLAYVIEAAQDPRQTHPLALAVRGAVEVGVVVPSILRSRLAAAGLEVISGADLARFGMAPTKVLTQVVVTQEDAIIAMGASSDADDALLHAMLGWFRENALPGADVPAGIAVVTKEG